MGYSIIIWKNIWKGTTKPIFTNVSYALRFSLIKVKLYDIKKMFIIGLLVHVNLAVICVVHSIIRSIFWKGIYNITKKKKKTNQIPQPEKPNLKIQAVKRCQKKLNWNNLKITRQNLRTIQPIPLKKIKFRWISPIAKVQIMNPIKTEI